MMVSILVWLGLNGSQSRLVVEKKSVDTVCVPVDERAKSPPSQGGN